MCNSLSVDFYIVPSIFKSKVEEEEMIKICFPAEINDDMKSIGKSKIKTSKIRNIDKLPSEVDKSAICETLRWQRDDKLNETKLTTIVSNLANEDSRNNTSAKYSDFRTVQRDCVSHIYTCSYQNQSCVQIQFVSTSDILQSHD